MPHRLDLLLVPAGRSAFAASSATSMSPRRRTWVAGWKSGTGGPDQTSRMTSFADGDLASAAWCVDGLGFRRVGEFESPDRAPPQGVPSPRRHLEP
jgi:hypothetical protein